MHLLNPMHCARKNRSGGLCRNWVMHGQTVCRMHGGSSPQALAKAEERLRSLVHPAISGLAELIARADSDSVRLSAIRDLLDRTGYKPRERVDVQVGPLIKTVVAEDLELLFPPDGDR
jgi:hypothetical protein